MTQQATLDVITIGRASVDLYGQQIGGRLEDMASFAKYVGGCPANIAVGTARLGLRSALLTRVGADHFGRFIIEQLQREQVCTDGIVQDQQRLTALAILGIRDQEQFPLLFYRENCADMALCEDDIDPAFIESAAAVLVTGTHFSTPTVRAASHKAIAIAKAAGRKVILDGDYRPVLWGLTNPDAGENRFVENDTVTSTLAPVLPLCDLIVATEEELHILGGSTDTLACLRTLREAGDATIVLKLGEDGCVVFDGAIPDNWRGAEGHSGFPIEVFNVLGAGDAFMSGFLRGWLRDLPLVECCKLANASGALVVSRHGCAPAIPSWDEIQYFINNGSPYQALRFDQKLEQVHWATTRKAGHSHVTALAFDHRSQFIDLAVEAGIEESAQAAKISQFKQLALRAAQEEVGQNDTGGILADERFGSRALEMSADTSLWVGRPIELPGSRPLQFEGGADVANTINQWPLNHVVKCLCFYHPDDSDALKAEQEAQLLRLFDACRQTRHELLLEIICSKAGAINDDTVASVMQRMYDIGIYPDWWKLEPQSNDSAWQNITDVIETNDAYCRGVVMLGLSASQEKLAADFAIAAKHSQVKGFAVGRTIFAAPALAWFKGDIDDDNAVAQMKATFGGLRQAWANAGGKV